MPPPNPAEKHAADPCAPAGQVGPLFKLDVPRRLTPMEIASAAAMFYMGVITTLPGDSVAVAPAFRTLEWYGPETAIGLAFALGGALTLIPAAARLVQSGRPWMKAWRVAGMFLSAVFWLALACQSASSILLHEPISISLGLVGGLGTGAGFATIELWRRWRG